MRYCERFLHRIHTNFLCITLEDYEEIKHRQRIEDEYVELSLDALCCLPYLPCIRHLILTPGSIREHDLSLLQGIHIQALKLDFYSYEIDNYTIDLRHFPELELLFARTQYCFCNAAACTSLKTLIVQEWLAPDLEYLCNASICALQIMSGKLKTLNGIQRFHNLISLSLSNQRYLSDITNIKYNRLESIEICSCNKIDTAPFSTFCNLRFLHISGKQKIASLKTLLVSTPKLEWLFLDHPLTDGDIFPALKLKHVTIFSNCRHYTHKDSDLPKSIEKFQSHFLPKELEILPEAF